MSSSALFALDQPPIAVFALCSVLLVVKMLTLGLYTTIVRRRVKAYINPEDARVWGGGVEPVAEQHPDVQRVRRAHRNDLETLLPFVVVASLYILGGASERGAQIYCLTFTITRIFHTLCYLGRLQPWRTINFVIGIACLIGMATQVLLKVFS